MDVETKTSLHCCSTDTEALTYNYFFGGRRGGREACPEHVKVLGPGMESEPQQ